MSTLIDPTPEQESLQRIAEAYREVDEAEQAEAQLKEEFAEAKAHTKEVKARFRQVLHGETVPLPLLDKPRRVEGVAHPEVPSDAAPSVDAAAGDAASAPPWGDGQDERWKAWPLSKLGLKPRTLANLEDADLFTVGQLAAWTQKGRPLTDLGGIGEAKASEIDDCLTAFWAARPDLAESAAAPEPAPEVAPESEPEPAASAFEPPADSFEPPSESFEPPADAADGDADAA